MKNTNLTFVVYLTNNAESTEVAAFANKQDAIEYVDNQLKGYTEVSSDDTDENNWMHYDIFNIAKATEENPFGDNVYTSKYVYND